jgi:hypothetical protein
MPRTCRAQVGDRLAGELIGPGGVVARGAHIARLATRPDTDATGVFLSENGGTYSW